MSNIPALRVKANTNTVEELWLYYWDGKINHGVNVCIYILQGFIQRGEGLGSPPPQLILSSLFIANFQHFWGLRSNLRAFNFPGGTCP